MLLAAPQSIWAQAEEFLLSDHREKFGFFLCGISQSTQGPRFSVREFLPVEDERLRTESGTGRRIAVDCLLDVINRAKQSDLAIVEVHTHPHTAEGVTFSHIDDQELPEFVAYTMDSLNGRPYAAVVLGQTSLDARYWEDADEPQPIERVLISGETFRFRIPTSSPLVIDTSDAAENRYDRQVRLLGEPGQHRLAHLRVGVVGVGGLGSHVVQQLAHMGIRDFQLVDPDEVEDSNLNRTVGVYPYDVGLPKVVLAERLIQQAAINEDVHVTTHQANVQSEEVIQSLLAVDVLVGCVDNDGARQVLNELSRVGHLPYMDLASGIETDDGTLAQMGGRIAVVQPDGPCLHCMNEIDLREARYYLKPEQEDDRNAEYIDEDWEIPNPSVISLNGVVASTGINEFLLYATGLDSSSALLYHYVREQASASQRLAHRRVDPDPDCFTCSLAGIGERAELERYTR